MELLEKWFLKSNVLSLYRSSQFLSVANKIKIQKGTNFKGNESLFKKIFYNILNQTRFNKLMFFKFSVGIVCINVVHQKTQWQKSSQSEIILIVNFWFDYNFLGYGKNRSR